MDCRDFRHGLVALVAMFITACATQQVTEQTAIPVPAARVYAAALVNGPAPASDAIVTFLRDKGLLGAGCGHDVYVNGVKAFAMRHNEFIRLHLAPGPYFFRVDAGTGICPSESTSQNTTLAPGEHQVYRIMLPAQGTVQLIREQ